MQSCLQDGAVVQAELEVDGRRWQVTCVSMGNPHALIYSSGERKQIKAGVASAARHCCSVLK